MVVFELPRSMSLMPPSLLFRQVSIKIWRGCTCLSGPTQGMTKKYLKQITAFSLQISHQVLGEVVNVDLTPNGKDTAVTKLNKVEFVALYVDYLLNKSIERQFNAFSRGFHKVCDSSQCRVFSTSVESWFLRHYSDSCRGQTLKLRDFSKHTQSIVWV